MTNTNSSEVNVDVNNAISDASSFKNNILDNVLMITLQIKMPSFSKSDPKISNEIIENKGARKKSGTFSKKLFSKEVLEPLTRAKNNVVNVRDKYLIKWGSSFIITVKDMQDFLIEIKKAQKEFKDAVDDFFQEDNYREAVENQKKEMNDLFDISHYPSAEEAKEKCSVWYTVDDIKADLSSFNLPDEIIKEIDVLNEQENKKREQEVIDSINDDIVSLMQSIANDFSNDEKVITGHTKNRLKKISQKLVKADEVLSNSKYVEIGEKINDLESIFDVKAMKEDSDTRELMSDQFNTIFDDINAIV